MNKYKRMFPAFITAPLALILGVAAPVAWADDDNEIPFDEAFLFFELNHTDGDLGIHGKIDGDAWQYIKIEDPKERRIMAVRNRGRLSKQGLTELFFESAEPQFSDLPPKKFFRRFPAGVYEIEGKTLEGEELESEVELTHVMPAPAVVYVNSNPAAENCDADPLPVIGRGELVTISWEPVTMSHPDPLGGGAGVQPPVPVTIHNYEVVAEIDETPWKTDTVLPPSATSFQVPSEILELSDEVKFEVLVREASYNQTAVESCFKIEG